MKPADRLKLTSALSKLVAKIAADLRVKMRTPGVAREPALRLHQDERVGEDFDVWTDLLSRRAAVLWVLKSVYVRVLEDRGLVSPGRLLDLEAQHLFEKLAPHLGETAFLKWIYKDLASPNGGLPELFSPQPAELALPSDELSRELIALWRHKDADTGAYWSFAEERFEGELMGDLYQELDPVVKDRFALCQTPDFVRAFILDRTLTPAIEEFGADTVRLLDPSCGSGHFLIDGLKRLVAATAEKHPDWSKLDVVQHALERVVGVDLNDYACGLARARLIMTAAELAGVTTLEGAAVFHPHVYWADGLEQVERDEVKPTLQLGLFEPAVERPRAELTRSDVRVALRKVFESRFSVVVANPPYIEESDANRKDYHRESVAGRQRYLSAYKQYHLSSPFIERCFQLSVAQAFVGLIVDEQFMRRDYGVPLVESVLPSIELSLVVDTSRADIPHHGTPTVILFARNRPPRDAGVPAVLSRRAEAKHLDDPSSGGMWRGILAAAKADKYQDEFVVRRLLTRSALARHPWVLGDDVAGDIVSALESLPHVRLGDAVSEMGRTTACGNDDAFVLSWHAVRTLGLEDRVLPFVEGAAVRDWSVAPKSAVVYPYAELGGAPLDPGDPRVPSYLWRYRSLLAARSMFGKTVSESGRSWFCHLEHYGARIRETKKISFSNIATHNHFALCDSVALFNSKAPVIVLDQARRARAPAVLAFLNSSLAAFWMKSRFQARGATSANRNHPDPERAAYEFSVTGLKQFPLADAVVGDSRVQALGEELIGLTAQRRLALSAAWLESPLGSIDDLRERALSRWRRHDELRQKQVFVQEEIDWLVYFLCGVVRSALLAPKAGPRKIPRGQRAFERRHGQRSFVRRKGRVLAASEAECETGQRELPEAYLEITQRRESELMSNDAVARVESYMYKRLWRDTEENVSEAEFRRSLDVEQAESVLLAKIEAAVSRRGLCSSVERIASDVMADSEFHVLLSFVRGVESFDLVAEVWERLWWFSVPSHRLHVYTPTGLVKREAWESVWRLQRDVDAGLVSADGPPGPEYCQGGRGKAKDFVRDEYWACRGPLDLPQERFIAFTEVPGRSGAETLYGWAGWTSTQRVKALLAVDETLEDQDIPLADRIGVLESAWRLLPDVAREDTAAAARFKAELQALVGPNGPSPELVAEWGKRFPPPKSRAAKAAMKPAAQKRAKAIDPEEDEES